MDAIMLGKSRFHEGNRNVLQSSGAPFSFSFFFFNFAPSSSASSFIPTRSLLCGIFFPSSQLESLLQLCNYSSSDFKEWLVHFSLFLKP